MNAVTIPATPSAAVSAMPLRRVLGAYLAEARSECLRYLRAPGFMLPIVLFPTLFYLMFGIAMGKSEGPDIARYLLASYGVFGVMSPGLFGFGASLAIERDGGLLTLKRALPMPPGAYLLGKMLMAMAAAALVILLLLGVLPFCAMGMFVGTLIKGQGAPGLLNLIYLPMSFLSGLWIPLPMLPKALQQIAPVWPSYHLDRLALAAVGMEQGAAWPHLLVLLGFSAVFLALATRLLRRFG